MFLLSFIKSCCIMVGQFSASLNSPNSVAKIFVVTVKGFKPATSCVRGQDANTVPACERQDL